MLRHFEGEARKNPAFEKVKSDVWSVKELIIVELLTPNPSLQKRLDCFG